MTAVAVALKRLRTGDSFEASKRLSTGDSLERKKGKSEKIKLNKQNIFFSRDSRSCRANERGSLLGICLSASKRLRTGDSFEASKRLRTWDLSVKGKKENWKK